MPHHQPLRRFTASLVVVKRLPDRHHQREQEQRESDTQHRQCAAALVAERVLGDKPGQRHRRTPERTGSRVQKAGTSQRTKNRRSTSLSTTGPDSICSTLTKRNSTASPSSPLYCRAAAPTTSGDRHQGGMTNVTKDCT